MIRDGVLPARVFPDLRANNWNTLPEISSSTGVVVLVEGYGGPNLKGKSWRGSDYMSELKMAMRSIAADRERLGVIIQPLGNSYLAHTKSSVPSTVNTVRSRKPLLVSF